MAVCAHHSHFRRRSKSVSYRTYSALTASSGRGRSNKRNCWQLALRQAVVLPALTQLECRRTRIHVKRALSTWDVLRANDQTQMPASLKSAIPHLFAALAKRKAAQALSAGGG